MVVGLMAFVGCDESMENDVVQVQPSKEEQDILKEPFVSPATLKMIAEVSDAVARINPLKVPYILNNLKVRQMESRLNTTTGAQKLDLMTGYGVELLRSGKTDASITVLSEVLNSMNSMNISNRNEALYVVKKNLAIAYMRKGEQENCIANHNDESCIIPISSKAQHLLRTGSEKCIDLLNDILALNPNDYECQYLLNIAHMTLGQYPDGVPKRFRLPEDYFTNNIDFPRFRDIAPDLNVDVNEKSGGTCLDDFNNDGYLDIIASSWGFNDQIRYFENDRNGGFIDKTKYSGLSGVVGGLNLKHADFNNDGHLDFIILRGAWLGEYGKIPNSLMQNNGDGTFTDVTVESGIYSKRPTQSAVWADFDLDGWLDIFIANESTPNSENRCELYLNKNGKFTDVSSDAGFDKTGFFKGAACGDINNDGLPDLYLSNYDSENTLYQNISTTGNLRFVDITEKAGVAEPVSSFPTWMFDYNNDGHIDIFVSGYASKTKTSSSLIIDNALKGYSGNRPLLYHNNGNGTFTERSLAAGLDEPITTMGCNFGDLDNDGFLDFYLATGSPSYFSIVPNRVYLNQNGETFEDISYVSGFGHIQKGHAIGFGDIDMDGDQDIYAVMGGAFEGDVFGNLLYENPVGNTNNWIHILLEGDISNRSAVGATIILTLNTENGPRMIYHTVGLDASFGGNSTIAELGLGAAELIQSIEIRWPNKERSKTILENVPCCQNIRIQEDNGALTVLTRPMTRFRTN